jgi:hypothetical protein
MNRHVLKLSCGLTVTLLLDEETVNFSCEWSERPTKENLPAILPEYRVWRDQNLEAWSKRNGKKMLVVEI